MRISWTISWENMFFGLASLLSTVLSGISLISPHLIFPQVFRMYVSYSVPEFSTLCRIFRLSLCFPHDIYNNCNQVKL